MIEPLKRKPGARKTKDTACEVAGTKISETPTSPPSKHSRAPSVVWDIELDKSLCDDVPFTSIAPVSKLGSVVLDVTCQRWAKQLNTERGRFDIVESLPNNSHSNCNNELAASIGPSQSASQMNISLAVQEEKRSKYFEQAPRKHEAQAKLHEGPLDPCIPRSPSPPVQVEGAVPVEVLSPIQSPDVAGGYIQEEPQYAEQSLAGGFSFGDLDSLDKGRESCPAAATEHKSHLPYNAYDDIENFEPPGEYDCSREDDISLPHEYEGLFFEDDSDMDMDMDMDRERELEAEYTFCPGFELCDPRSDPDGIIQDELEMNEHCSYQQGEDEPNEVCGFEDSISISSDHGVDSNSIGQTPSNSEEEEQVHRFSQGRALLLGYSMHEVGHPGKARPSFPRLSVLEADVAKSLRDHWHPQRL